MAASIAAKAQRRAVRFAAAVRELLADGCGDAALTEAVARLRSEAAKVRRQRPADGALIDAELAGTVLAAAARLSDHKPERPEGCGRRPEPEHLLAVFAASYSLALQEGESDA